MTRKTTALTIASIYCCFDLLAVLFYDAAELPLLRKPLPAALLLALLLLSKSGYDPSSETPHTLPKAPTWVLIIVLDVSGDKRLSNYISPDRGSSTRIFLIILR